MLARHDRSDRLLLQRPQLPPSQAVDDVVLHDRMQQVEGLECRPAHESPPPMSSSMSSGVRPRSALRSTSDSSWSPTVSW